MNFKRKISDAIVQNGGIATDINFFTDEMANEIGKKLATKGIKTRTPNPAFSVKPINTVKGIKKFFDWMYTWITTAYCPLKLVVDESKVIELIKCKPMQSTEETLKEIDGRGFIPAPSNYVLGIGVNHPDVHKEYKYIISLDKNNIFTDEGGDPCFLCLGFDGERYLSMADEASHWGGRWWFAVVRKEPLTS